MKTKEQIMNEYAVNNGYDSWIELLERLGKFLDVLNICIYSVIDLIQKELLNRVAIEVDSLFVQYTVKNTQTL